MSLKICTWCLCNWCLNLLTRKGHNSPQRRTFGSFTQHAIVMPSPACAMVRLQMQTLFVVNASFFSTLTLTKSKVNSIEVRGRLFLQPGNVAPATPARKKPRWKPVASESGMILELGMRQAQKSVSDNVKMYTSLCNGKIRALRTLSLSALA